MAALQGVDLDGANESDEERFERIRRQAQAQLAGKSEEELVLGDIGFGYEAS